MVADGSEPWNGTRQATGYRLVSPPGWIQVPVRDATQDTPRQVVRDAFGSPPAGVPRDALTRARIAMERRLATMITEARRNGGLDLYLPSGRAYDHPVPASFLVAEGSPGPGSADDPLTMVTGLAAADPRARVVIMDGAPAVRTEQTAGPDPRHGIAHRSLRVSYTIPVPGDDSRWLVITFSTPGPDDPGGEHAVLLAELFDAIMSTFRWTGRDPEGARQ